MFPHFRCSKVIQKIFACNSCFNKFGTNQMGYKEKRKCTDCFQVRLNKVCNGLGKDIEEYQEQLRVKAGGRKVSKEKTVMKILRTFFESKSEQL